MTRPSPTAAWASLQAGNERFVAGVPEHPRQDVERRDDLVGGQSPFVAIFGCSDSRLAAEIIFDLGLGDAFVVRNAGQVASDSVLGSLDYAVGVLGISLIVVLGHDECGAVRTAIDSQSPDAPPLSPNVDYLIRPIVPAVRRVAGAEGFGPVDVSHVDPLDVGREHLRDTVDDLLAGSAVIRSAVTAGTLGLVGANYRLSEGRAVADVTIGLD